MTETKKKNTENSKEKLFMRVLEMNWKSEKIEKTSVYNTRQKKRFTQSKKMYDCEVSPAIFCLDCTFRKVQSFMAPVCLSRHKSSVSPHHPFACVFKLFHCFFHSIATLLISIAIWIFLLLVQMFTQFYSLFVLFLYHKIDDWRFTLLLLDRIDCLHKLRLPHLNRCVLLTLHCVFVLM